jgi:CRISPR-associated protein Csx14
MTEETIPVDLRKPGQVFACLGLMEAAEVLFPETEVTGSYAWEDGTTTARFTLIADDAATDPIDAVVRFVAGAEVRSLNAPLENGNGVVFTTEKWDVTTAPFGSGAGQSDRYAFPFPPPDSPAALPVELRSGEKALRITHWGDDAAGGRDNVKFWAGAGGYPGAALARDAVALVKALGANALAQAAADPFGFQAPMSSCFRFDWRQSYVPLDAGFSPNAHGAVEMVGYPLVELLAAVGLEHSRPERPDPRNKLAYRYAVSNALLPTVLARAVLGGQATPFPVRRFRVRLDWPGQEGQARCIVDIWEE